MGGPIRHADTAPAAADGISLPFKRWDTVVPNASCAVALIDRLTRHAEILVIEGRNYRRRKAELAQQQRKRRRPRGDERGSTGRRRIGKFRL